MPSGDTLAFCAKPGFSVFSGLLLGVVLSLLLSLSLKNIARVNPAYAERPVWTMAHSERRLFCTCRRQQGAGPEPEATQGWGELRELLGRRSRGRGAQSDELSAEPDGCFGGWEGTTPTPLPVKIDKARAALYTRSPVNAHVPVGVDCLP